MINKPQSQFTMPAIDSSDVGFVRFCSFRLWSEDHCIIHPSYQMNWQMANAVDQKLNKLFIFAHGIFCYAGAGNVKYFSVFVVFVYWTLCYYIINVQQKIVVLLRNVDSNVVAWHSFVFVGWRRRHYSFESGVIKIWQKLLCGSAESDKKWDKSVW